MPELCIPADIYHNDMRYVIKYYWGMNKTKDRTCQNDAANRTSMWEQTICENISIRKTEEEMQQMKEIENINYCIITDGGTYEYNGTFGIIITHDDSLLDTNYGKLYSPEFYKSSYRSELYLVLAGIITLRAIIG
jgi:hypothetical protein